MKKIHKRLLSVLMVVLILVISCVYPFVNASAIAVSASLAIAGLSALIGSLAAGIANGSAQELTGLLINDITSAAELVSDNWGTGVNSIATDFNNFVSDFFDGYTIDGISVNGSDVASFVDYDSGTASIQYSDYERLRSQFAGSLYKPESDLVDDYLSIGSFPVLYRGSSITMTVSDSLNLLNKYSSRLNSKGQLYTFLLALVNGKWCVVCHASNGNTCVSDKTSSGWCMGDSTSYFFSHTYLLNGNKLTSFGTRIDGSTDDYSTGLQVYDVLFRSVNGCSVQSGTPSDFILILSNSDFTASSSYSTVCSYISKYISDTTSITGTVETPSVDFENNDLQNIIENGQNVGVVDENPTLTFVPTDTASAEVLIDDKPIAEVEAAIEDVLANGDFDVQTPSVIIDKFPFCIPFDIYKLFNIFSAEPQAPHFQVPITIVNGSPVNIDIDLSEWNWIAEIVRWFLWIIFVVGLLAVTNKLIGRG